jgi:hypothetical protein
MCSEGREYSCDSKNVETLKVFLEAVTAQGHIHLHVHLQ